MWRLIFILFIFLFSCEYLQPRETKEARVIAEAGGEKLLEENIAGLIPSNSSANDSATFVEKFVNDWIKKQLMIYCTIESSGALRLDLRGFRFLTSIPRGPVSSS